MFKIDAADYMISICGNAALRELSSPGKSGSVFFLSQDDRFMIKTLRKSEVQVCLSPQISYRSICSSWTIVKSGSYFKGNSDCWLL